MNAAYQADCINLKKYDVLKRINRYVKNLLRFGFAMLFIAVGVLHFKSPGFFAAIIPEFFPEHLALVYISGAAEIAGGLGLLIPRLRSAAGIGLIILLLAVFPANINMAVNSIDFGLPHFILWWRLPFQFVLIAFAWWLSRPDKQAVKTM